MNKYGTEHQDFVRGRLQQNTRTRRYIFASALAILATIITMMFYRHLLPLATVASTLSGVVTAVPYNTFDGEGFAACNEVSSILHPTSVAELQAIVKDAAAAGNPVRASGKGHMWYDTMCRDDLKTVVVVTEGVTGISDFNLAGGYVWIEAGVTFFQLAEYLHERGASVGYALVNWNITIAGAIASGSHRSSLSTDSMVASGALALDIIDGTGKIRSLTKDYNNDQWLAATTSLGLLGIISRVKFAIYPDTKLYAMQETLDESDVLGGDIPILIEPYVTANLWWWPYLKKFHWRYYDVVSNSKEGNAFQSTFSISSAEAGIAKALLDSGKYLPSSNWLAEGIFKLAWDAPNFHNKETDAALLSWPVIGWNYDVLIGGLYPDMKTEWDYGLRAYTMELAFPVTQANKLLKRIRALFDASAAAGKTMTSTYRSGINIKFGKPFENLLGQVHTMDKDVDWSKGAIMFDFPSYWPTVGDHKRYNEEFYHNLTMTLINEFPCRPHWTKNTREVFTAAKKNLNATNLARFKKVRAEFDPKGMFGSVVGDIIGVA